MVNEARSLSPKATPGSVVAALRAQGASVALGAPSSEAAPPTLAEALLVVGGVVEVQAAPGTGVLSAVLSLLSSSSGLLLAVDPQRRLCAPAVALLGVTLSRFVVAQPPPERALRVAARGARTGVFGGVVVDARALTDLGPAFLGARRLGLGAEEGRCCVVLLTSPQARRPQALPVAGRAVVESDRGGATLVMLRHKDGVLGRFPLPALAEGAVDVDEGAGPLTPAAIVMTSVRTTRARGAVRPPSEAPCPPG